MIYPRFMAESFWNFSEACELVGARYPAIPLGLITVGGDAAEILERAARQPQHRGACGERSRLGRHGDDRRHAVPAVGFAGPHRDVPRALASRGGRRPGRQFQPAPLRDRQFSGGRRSRRRSSTNLSPPGTRAQREGTFESPKFQVDVTKTPVPRYDLLKFEQYLYIGVQFSRGCPFTCEFCDIIELYGRSPRTKTHAQMLNELEALYQLGYRGHVDFVDDNLIGNKKAIKAFLPHLQQWIEQHDYPFEFTTEASLNLADDGELLEMLKRTNFFAIFVGIESPDTDTLDRRAQEAEYAPQHRRERAQDLQGRHVRDRGLYCRLRH